MAVRKKKKAAVGPATSSKAKVHPKHSAKRQGQTKRKIKTSRKKRTATPTQSFRFLALPAEIRNSIYELALKSSTPILVERKLKSPPLLSTCTQIRSKAASIWYRDNKFYARVPNCDAAAVNKWSQHCCTVGQRDYFDVAIKLFGGIEWSNLLKWCQAVWEDDRARRLAWQADLNDLDRVVSEAHDIAMRYKDKSWKACVRALEDLRMDEQLEGNHALFIMSSRRDFDADESGDYRP